MESIQEKKNVCEREAGKGSQLGTFYVAQRASPGSVERLLKQASFRVTEAFSDTAVTEALVIRKRTFTSWYYPSQ